MAAASAFGAVVETSLTQAQITICSQKNDKCVLATASRGTGSGFQGLIYFSDAKVKILTRASGKIEEVRGKNVYLDFGLNRVVAETVDAKGNLHEEVIELKDFSRSRFKNGRGTL